MCCYSRYLRGMLLFLEIVESDSVVSRAGGGAMLLFLALSLISHYLLLLDNCELVLGGSTHRAHECFHRAHSCARRHPFLKTLFLVIDIAARVAAVL